MITINEIANQKLEARRMGYKSKFLTDFYNAILDATTNEKTTGYVLFDGFSSKIEFEVFKNTVKDEINYNYYLKTLVDEIDVRPEDYEIEVYFNTNNRGSNE